MAEFEPESFGVGSDCSAVYATTYLPLSSVTRVRIHTTNQSIECICNNAIIPNLKGTVIYYCNLMKCKSYLVMTKLHDKTSA